MTGLADLVSASDIVLAICPPHGAAEMARAVSEVARRPGPWWYVDANAVSPATTELIGATVRAAGAGFVDGGVIGPPPRLYGTTRLYLSGLGALAVSEVLGTARLEVHVISEQPGDASALKLAYAAWTKGSAALLLAARASAARAGVEEALVLEWRTSLPDLVDRYQAAKASADDKGWRWAGEMEEIAAMFESQGLPSGFHEAAAEVFRRPPPH
jgi:3-hydroxyisobutyrate dehydrogenase-like beta-hydroxyacid dehydrogenase